MGRSLIILTGSNGFIGSHFKKYLNDVLEIEIDNCLDFIKNFNKWDEVDLIIHQGAISSTTEKDALKIFKWNVEFSIKLMEKAIEYKIPIKYASSASVYGNENIFNPLNQYSISKLQVDYWVMDRIDLFSHVQGFRYFNVYGDGEGHKGDQASPVSKFSSQIKETGRLKLFEGSEEFLRDFICVDDVVDVVLNNTLESGIYDLGTSRPVSFQYVAEQVAEKYNGEIDYVPFPKHLIGKYQYYTCAKEHWEDKIFMTVKDYLN